MFHGYFKEVKRMFQAGVKEPSKVCKKASRKFQVCLENGEWVFHGGFKGVSSMVKKSCNGVSRLIKRY